MFVLVCTIGPFASVKIIADLALKLAFFQQRDSRFSVVSYGFYLRPRNFQVFLLNKCLESSTLTYKVLCVGQTRKLADEIALASYNKRRRRRSRSQEFSCRMGRDLLRRAKKLGVRKDFVGNCKLSDATMQRTLEFVPAPTLPSAVFPVLLLSISGLISCNNWVALNERVLISYRY